MYFEINVSLNGKHFFATAERSITTSEKANEMVSKFREVFPESDGYKIGCTRYETVGYILEI